MKNVKKNTTRMRLGKEYGRSGKNNEIRKDDGKIGKRC